MGIKNVKTVFAGEVGVNPSVIRIETDDTVAAVQVAGYLNNINKQFALRDDMMALVSTKTSPAATATQVAWMEVSKSGSNWSLSPSETTIALDNGKILVGNASGVAAEVTMSGDATLSNAGVLTIAANAVELSMLATGITPSHVVKFAGQPTTGGGAAAEAITVTGALATDLAFVQMVDDGTNNVTIIDAVVTADTLTVTFSADPGNDAVINYQLLRAAS